MCFRILINVILSWIFLVNFSILDANADELMAAKKVVYDKGGRRDPFIPLHVSGHGDIQGLYGVQSVEDIELGGVVVDAVSGSMVIANGVVLKEGETRDNVKVVEVREDGVMFLINEIEQFKPFEVESL